MIIGVQLFKFRCQETEVQTGQVKCSSSPAGSRSPEVIAQSSCPSVWPCGVEGTGTYESECQLSCLPTKWASLAHFPPLKWGRRHQPHRLGAEKAHALQSFLTCLVEADSEKRWPVPGPWFQSPCADAVLHGYGGNAAGKASLPVGTLWTQVLTHTQKKGPCKGIHLGKTTHCSALVNFAFS